MDKPNIKKMREIADERLLEVFVNPPSYDHSNELNPIYKSQLQKDSNFSRWYQETIIPKCCINSQFFYELFAEVISFKFKESYQVKSATALPNFIVDELGIRGEKHLLFSRSYLNLIE